MSGQLVHQFVACAFPENFPIGDIKAAMGAGPSLLDPRTCVVRETANGGRIFAYNFGALTFLDVPTTEREAEIAALRRRFARRLGEVSATDDFVVEEGVNETPRVEFSKLVLDKMTPQRAEVVAVTLAQSAAMSYYEAYVVKVHAKVSLMVERLARRGTVGRRPKALHLLIAEAVEMRSEIVGVLHFLDRPDLIWDDSVMDALYTDLRTVFDLQERFDALVHKLDFIQQTMGIMLDMARDSRAFLIELGILLLIFFEIVMSFVRGS